MKKREKTDKLAQSYIAEKYCILYKTFIITGTEILLPQYIFEEEQQDKNLVNAFCQHLKKCQTIYWRAYYCAAAISCVEAKRIAFPEYIHISQTECPFSMDQIKDPTKSGKIHELLF